MGTDCKAFAKLYTSKDNQKLFTVYLDRWYIFTTYIKNHPGINSIKNDMNLTGAFNFQDGIKWCATRLGILVNLSRLERQEITLFSTQADVLYAAQKILHLLLFLIRIKTQTSVYPFWQLEWVTILDEHDEPEIYYDSSAQTFEEWNG